MPISTISWNRRLRATGARSISPSLANWRRGWKPRPRAQSKDHTRLHRRATLGNLAQKSIGDVDLMQRLVERDRPAVELRQLAVEVERLGSDRTPSLLRVNDGLQRGGEKRCPPAHGIGRRSGGPAAGHGRDLDDQLAGDFAVSAQRQRQRAGIIATGSGARAGNLRCSTRRPSWGRRRPARPLQIGVRGIAA